MITRRALVQQLLGVGAVAPLSVAPPASDSDRTEYAGWLICWSGWADIPNQLVSLGKWVASRPGREKAVVATTLGHVGEYYDMELIDCARYHEWPLITVTSTDRDREAVKRAARVHLMRYLQAL